MSPYDPLALCRKNCWAFHPFPFRVCFTSDKTKNLLVLWRNSCSGIYSVRSIIWEENNTSFKDEARKWQNVTVVQFEWYIYACYDILRAVCVFNLGGGDSEFILNHKEFKSKWVRTVVTVHKRNAKTTSHIQE